MTKRVSINGFADRYLRVACHIAGESWGVPINVRRRIFRSGGLAPLGAGRSSRGMTLGVLAGALVLTSGFWAALGPSEAPASSLADMRLSVPADTIEVIDAATLRLPDRVIQLAGVAPPERGQMCLNASGTAADCGAEAAHALAALLRGGALECDLRGAGQSGRLLAVCFRDGQAVNRALVLAGWARGDVTVPGLTAAQTQARAAGRGLWAGQRALD